MPACFWVKLFEIAQERTNPILHTMNCTKYDFRTITCNAGHPIPECEWSCPDYVAEKVDYSTYLECNGDCTEHRESPADA